MTRDEFLAELGYHVGAELTVFGSDRNWVGPTTNEIKKAVLILHNRLEAMEINVDLLEKRDRAAPEIVITSNPEMERDRMLAMLAKQRAAQPEIPDGPSEDLRLDMLREMLELRELLTEGFNQREWVMVCAAKKEVERLIATLTK